jgi:REP element-mobilizing transposase RayT
MSALSERPFLLPEAEWDFGLLARRPAGVAEKARSQEWLRYSGMHQMSYYERHLPHWHPEGRVIFVTWRLRDSLPTAMLIHLSKLKQHPGKQFIAADRTLDLAKTGPRWLSDPRVAECAEAAIRRGAELGQYLLHAYVVMSNHVHLLIEPHIPLRRITAGIKGVSAREANAILGRKGKPFWQSESFDHWVRNQAQFERVRRYIENNPVAAGLARRPEDWTWSSARVR